MPISIFSIKSKFVHLAISSFLPKLKLLKIAKNSKRLQSLTDISIEDYEIYSLQFINTEKVFTLSSRSVSSSLKSLKTIIDVSKSYPLYNDHKEINVPTPVYAMLQIDDNKIIASTETSLLIIDSLTFNIQNEIKINTPGAIVTLLDVGNHTILFATFSRCIRFLNLSTSEIANEITGSNPIVLSGGRVAYTWEGKELRVISLNTNIELDEIEIDKVHQEENEDLIVISSMIELANGNIMMASWNGGISEYDLRKKICVKSTKVDIEYVDFLLELKDERIAFTVNDNAHIYIYDKNKNDKNIMTLVGHNKNVIKLIQLDNEQIVSASNDGKVKFWVKEKEIFINSMTLYLFNDYIRNMIMLSDGRICVCADDKCIRALGVKNNIGNFFVKYVPMDREGKGNCFEIVDDRLN